MPDNKEQAVQCGNCEKLEEEKQELEALVVKMSEGMKEANKGVKILNRKIQELEAANFILKKRLTEVVKPPTGRA